MYYAHQYATYQMNGDMLNAEAGGTYNCHFFKELGHIRSSIMLQNSFVV
jgi:hypothetical protein